MKLKICFEVDASGTSYNIKNKNDEVTLVIQNLTFLLQKLQSDVPMRKIEILSSDHDDKMKKALMKHCDEDGKILSQMFDNFTVEGTMEDGKKFTFTHIEPGYEESLVFHA